MQSSCTTNPPIYITLEIYPLGVSTPPSLPNRAKLHATLISSLFAFHTEPVVSTATEEVQKFEHTGLIRVNMDRGDNAVEVHGIVEICVGERVVITVRKIAFLVLVLYTRIG